MPSLTSETLRRPVYDFPALALVLIEPGTGGASGQPDGTHRRGEPGELLERLQAGGFDLAARDESLLPPRAAHLGPAPAPRYLAAFGLGSPQNAPCLLRRLGVAAPHGESPREVADAAGLGHRSAWTLWTRLATVGPRSGEASMLYAVVMSPPELADRAGADEFERYYADRHLGEIVEEIGYLRASLFAAASLPDGSWRHGPGRYLAVYEAAGEQALQRQAARVQAMASQRFDGAPPGWASRRVAWRAAFRPMAPLAGSGTAERPPARAVARQNLPRPFPMDSIPTGQTSRIMEVGFTYCK